MRNVLLTCLALIVSASAALAADAEPMIAPGPFSPPPAFPHQGPVVTPGPFDPPPAFPAIRAYDWTGFYIGINGGGAFGSAKWTSVPDLTSGTANASGGLAGGTAGYNLQAGDPFVVGIEGDFDWSGTSTTIAPASCAPGCEFNVPWLATARLRFGYAFDRILPYVTGGVAIARLNANIVGAPFGPGIARNLGWTAGAGVEVVITGAWRAKVEYLRVDLNGFSCDAACGGGPISFNLYTNVFRAGLNYRLWMN